MITLQHLVKSIEQDLPNGGSYSYFLHQSLIQSIKENNFPIIIFKPEGLYWCISLRHSDSLLFENILGFYRLVCDFRTHQDAHAWIDDNLGEEFNNHFLFSEE